MQHLLKSEDQEKYLLLSPDSSKMWRGYPWTPTGVNPASIKAKVKAFFVKIVENPDSSRSIKFSERKNNKYFLLSQAYKKQTNKKKTNQ